ncbi:MAG TPA: hypothetical protein VIV12_23100 [Streptosporangiaceae bacterium]
MTDYRTGRDGYSQYLRQLERENGGSGSAQDTPPRDTGCPWPTGVHNFRTRVCTRCGASENKEATS